MSLVITLDPAQVRAAEQYGERRYNWKVKNGFAKRETNDGGGTWLAKEKYGAVAEYALAKHYGRDVLIHWVSTQAFSNTPQNIPCDVGLDLHVRATDQPYNKLLIVHEDKGRTRVEEPAERRHRRPSDPLSGVFIFAWVDRENSRVTFYGWETAQNVRAAGWNDTTNGFNQPDRGAYTLDRAKLLPMDTIPHEAIWHD